MSKQIKQGRYQDKDKKITVFTEDVLIRFHKAISGLSKANTKFEYASGRKGDMVEAYAYGIHKGMSVEVILTTYPRKSYDMDRLIITRWPA